jgi:hypothetical protein
MDQEKHGHNPKFSRCEKLIITIMVFTAVMILGFLAMLLTGKMVLPF